MSDSAFDPFLAEVASALRQRPEQSAAVTDELRDHLQQRLAELLERGVPGETAVQAAIEELGDAAALAAEFNTVSRDLRRRWIMRYASGSIAAAVVVFFVTLAFWPDSPRVNTPPQVTAQDKAAKDAAPAKDAAAPARPKPPTPEENNARVEAMLVGNRVKADLKAMPLEEFIANLRTIRTVDGKELSLEISLETAKFEEAGAKLDAPITFIRSSMRLDRLIDHVLGRAGLGFYLDDGVLVVSSNEHVDTHLTMRVYDCRDLMELPRPKGRGGVEPGSSDSSAGAAGDGSLAAAVAAAGGDAEFVRLLLGSIKPDSWQHNGGPGSVSYYRGLLIVWQSDPRHREINDFLEQLRQAVAKQSQATKDK